MQEILTNPLTGQAIAENDLEAVAELARELYHKATRIEAMEGELAKMKDEHRKLEMETLPMAMERIGLSSLELNNGVKLEINDVFAGSIPSMDKDPVRRIDCFQWLRKNNFGALIKTEVKVQGGKGDEQLIKKVTAMLKKAKIAFFQKDDVHHMTLKAFIKEQCQAGNPPPVELFNTFQGKRAVLDIPKQQPK